MARSAFVNDALRNALKDANPTNVHWRRSV